MCVCVCVLFAGYLKRSSNALCLNTSDCWEECVLVFLCAALWACPNDGAHSVSSTSHLHTHLYIYEYVCDGHFMGQSGFVTFILHPLSTAC